MDHLQTLHSSAASSALDPVQDKIVALAWAPNGEKLAVATAGSRTILLYDTNQGIRRDKFPTKPAGGASSNKDKGTTGSSSSYFVRALAFSSDSTKLAVAQSDGGVFVYRLGGPGWGDEKKSICHKFLHESPVTSLLWPEEGMLVYGLAEGLVVAANLKSIKTVVIGDAGNDTSSTSSSYVTALAATPSDADGTVLLVVSAHYDGSLHLHSISQSSSSSSSSRRLAQHSCAVFALAWGGSGIIFAAGNDQRVVAYQAETGAILQVFDYADSKCRDFTVATAAAPPPCSSALALGNFDSIYIYSSAPSPQLVEIHQVPNLYNVTALAWHVEGRRLAVGSFCGVVDIYEVNIPPSPIPPPTLFQEAQALSIEQGIQLLQEKDQLEAAVDDAIARSAFDYALKLCDLSLPTKLCQVHLSHALYLQEQQGQEAEAEEAFLLAKAPRKAIDMYLKLGHHANARRLAEVHEPSLVPSILQDEANALQRHHQKGPKLINKEEEEEEEVAKHRQAEALYLQAGQPERALAMYQDARRWPDAFRIAQRYVPHRLGEAVAAAVAATYKTTQPLPLLLPPPQQHHLDILTHVTATDNAQNLTTLSQALDFLGQQKEWGHVWSMLEFCKIESNTSGESFQALLDKMVVMQAQQALFKGKEKEKDKKQQDGYCPSYSLSQLQEAVHVLKTYGGPSFAYLDFYRAHLVRPILGARSLREEQEGGEAFLTLVRDLRQVLYEVQRGQDEQKATQSKKKTRANKTTMATTDAATLELQEEGFRDLFLAVHFTFIILSTRNESIPLEMRCKVAITLLHYAPSVLPSDKAFYQAGMLLRELASETAATSSSIKSNEQEMATAAVGYKHLAFLFLNRYIDVAEAIEDKMSSSSSSSGEEEEEDPNLFVDFKPLASCTNLCQHDVTPLPPRQYLEEDTREEIKTWVLAVCTEKGSNTHSIQNVALPTAGKARGTVWEGLFASAPGGPWCVVTGYSIHEAGFVLGGGGGGKYQASKKEWEVYVKGCGVCPWTGEKVEGEGGDGATATATTKTNK